MLITLSACGNDDGDGGTVLAGPKGDPKDGFDAFEISGDQGAKPEIKWNGPMDADKIESETIIDGEGAELKTGSKVLVNFTVGNGYSQSTEMSTYDEDGGGAQEVTVNNEMSPVFKEAVEGHKVGDRVAVVASAEEAFGELGNPQLGIGNTDSVLLVVDIASGVRAKASGKSQASPAWAPAVVSDKGTVTALDFAGTPEPGDALESAPLIKGTGPEVTDKSTITIKYLGQVYDGAKPFDENFSKDAITQPIGGFVPGFKQGLVGQTVGSRVIISIPPKLGYGDKAQGEIPANSHLFFVVDILAAG